MSGPTHDASVAFVLFENFRGIAMPNPLNTRLRAFGLSAALAVATIVAGISAGMPSTASAADYTVQADVSVQQTVRDALAAGENPAVLVKFKGKADLSTAFSLTDRDARATYVYETLRDFAARKQMQTRQTLSAQFGLSEAMREYTVLWIDNSIAIARLTPSLLGSLEASSEIASIRTQRVIPLPVDEEVADTGSTPNAAIGSIARIKAPDVWALGFTGQGTVLANIDSGVRYTHQALVNQYRGNLGGGSFDHQYNWYDPYNHAATPRTTHPHGTHTMGTILGDNGSTEQIGVAPEAKWINCIGFGAAGGDGTDAGLLECGQWMLAPTNIAGDPGSADPTKRPDVVNNSWGDCGRSYDNWYEGVIDGWIAAGIAPVFSNGNNSNCSYPSNPPLNTVGNPARSGKVLGVGSTGNTNGTYATHSNKGPTDNLNPGLPNYPDHFGFPNLKPNVMAPGVSIRSAYDTNDSSYGNMTGTSMSSPAVTGTIGLMWSAAPCIHGNWARTGTILMETATRIPVNTGSPSDGPGNIPNQATGWGEINALAAVQAAQDYCINGAPPSLSKSFSPAQVPTAGTPTTLTITLNNAGQTGPSTLTAALTDNLPTGLVVAGTPNASTTCTGGSVTAAAGGSSVTLASGASIPGAGSCTVKVDVTAGALGTYTNTIPGGSLQTDNGTHASDASANVKYGLTFPEPYCPVTFPSGIEPITRVVFDGIDNTSPATGGPPLQDFTSVVGTAGTGDTLAMRVEGNTAGPFSTQIKVYIDWNQDGIFTDATEAYYIGALTNSNGADGKFVAANITVPATAVAGNTRMRVTKKYGSSASSAAAPCNTTGYGQAEDYTLTVTGGSPVTWTVTPSVGTPSGTITPATAVTVNDGATATFTLAADTGFQIDNVSGTCGGTLAGSSYETDPVTADCTVIANFAPASGGGNGLRISQIYGAGGNSGATYKEKYVELFNSGSAAILLTGKSLQYAAPAGTNWSGKTNLTGTIAAHGYFLVQVGSGANGAAMPATPDQTSTSWAPGGTNGNLALVDGTAALSCQTTACATDPLVIDLVGYGTGAAYEGTAAAPATSSTMADFRAGDGCTDTNDNGDDFSLASPNPRNSGSALNLCSTPATWTVTPSVGTPSGTITPNNPQTVNNGDTKTFTLAAATGFHIDTVGGTCGGTLTGSSFETDPVTADCTVIANFAADPPVIDVTPASLAASQQAGLTSTQTLTIANIGGGALNWSIDEENTAAPRATAPHRPAAPAPVVTSSSDCPQYENYAGREPDGWAGFCGAPAPTPSGLVNWVSADTAYALDVRNHKFVQFTLNDLPGQTQVGAQADTISGMDFDPTATTLYALNDATGELGTINLTTGAFTGIVACTVPGGGSWSGLSIDPVLGTFYASTNTNLYVLNPATCSPTLIGPFGTGGVMIDIAVNTAGQMYGHDIDTDSIYSINTATGAATLVGATGYDANFAQGMDFDNEDGTLYIFLYTGGGTNTFGTVNLATGAVMSLAQNNPLGEFEGAIQTAATTQPCAVPADIPWLSLDTSSGSIAGGLYTDVTVTFDSTGYGVGVYSGNLCVNSNDTTQPLVPVPVTLTVEAPPPVAIFCSSFEDGEDGSCGTTP